MQHCRHSAFCILHSALCIALAFASANARAADWTYDANAKTVTDGDWTIKVSGAINALVVGNATTNAASGILDLTKPIVGGGAFASIGGSAFQGNNAVKEVYLPDSVTTFGGSAFYNCKSLGRVTMGENVTTLGGWGAFYGCSALTNVTPLLPAAVTQIGDGCFRDTKIVGDLYLGTNGASVAISGSAHFQGSSLTSATLGDGVTSIPASFFYNCKSLGRVRMSENVTALGGWGPFYGCSALTNVTPLLPAAVRQIGEACFQGTKIAGDLYLATNGVAVVFSNGSQFNGTKITSATLGDGVATIPGGFFQNCSELGSIRFGEGLTSLTGWGPFYGCSKLKDFWFSGSVPTIGADVFQGVGTGQTLLHLPKTEAAWLTWITDYVTPWADLGDGDKNSFHTKWPDEGDPVGRSVSGTRPPNQWVCTYIPGGGSASGRDLVVSGAPGLFGTEDVSPAYGTYLDIGTSPGLPLTLTAPPIAYDSSRRYACAGYVIEDEAALGWENAVTNALANPASPSVVYDPAEAGMMQFTWLWNVTGYELIVSQPSDASIGSISVSGADPDTYFPVGATATVTASNGTGTFVRWHGDVPSGHETDMPLQIVMDCPKSLFAEFLTDWVYTSTGGSNGTVTDGEWTINVTGPIGALVIGTPTVNSPFGILDFTKPIVGGGAFASIGGGAFQGNNAVTEVRLPDTVTAVEGNAFYNCTSLGKVTMGEGVTRLGGWGVFYNCSSLTNVTPLLPAALTQLGDSCFYGTKLAGDLYLGTNGAHVVLDKTAHFQGTAITSATLGDGVTSIPGNFFYNCKSLGRVRMSENVTALGGWGAFNACSSLTNVTPLLPASVTFVGSECFNGAPVAGDLYFATNGASASFDGTSNFRSMQIASATFGDGVATIPGGLFQSCSKLESIRFGEGLTSITGWGPFYDCPKLTELWFAGSVPTFGSDVFQGVGAGKTRLHLPKTDAAWLAWLADNATPWADLGESVQNGYWAKWPDEKKPYGRSLSAARPASQWICLYIPGKMPTVIFLR